MSRLLRCALLAYPRVRRERDGAVLLDCAAELAAAGSSPAREAVGLVAGGIAARAGVARAELRAAPWRAAGVRLALPLACANLALWCTGAAHLHGMSLGRWWTGVLLASAAAFLGAVARRRGVALLGWAALAALVGHALLTADYDTHGSR
jgi:hypothetical protein